MTTRWQKGTNDHDGDGRKGGSISSAEASARATEKDTTVAKQPKNTEAPKSDAKAAEKPAPSQPWAKPAAKADAEPAKEDAPAVVNDATIPSEARDQVTPSGDANAAHDQAREEAAAGNGGGVPSELVDQHTPTGPSPREVDEQAEALTPDSSPNRVDAAAKDQVTPVGDDLSSQLHEQFKELTEDEQAEFHRFMGEQAQAKLKQLSRTRKAREMEVNIIDGSGHYGKKVPERRNKTVEE